MSFVRSGDYIRLNALCHLFGWQGGTIHMAKQEAENCLEEELSDLISMSESDFQEVYSRLATSYPRWIAFHREECRE